MLIVSLLLLLRLLRIAEQMPLLDSILLGAYKYAPSAILNINIKYFMLWLMIMVGRF